MLSTTMAMESPLPPPVDLETLFREHNRMVYRTAFRLTRNSSDAEDVLQTVFLRLASRDLTAAPLGQAEAYLRRAAVNAALDLIRQRKHSADDGEKWISLQAAPASEQPEHQMWVRQAADWLRGAVSGLSEQAAEIFVLRFFEERGNAEIAEMVGSSANSVAVTLHRSRERLREEFQQLIGGQHV
ncbi:MAG: sigma-70 family RNA polymerase sigma factor [Bryobacterales bacterium]|nr:sigma-70 family RNA polymerase sigma factor [Bryobacterales bacterium]